METPSPTRRPVRRMSRRSLLHAGLAAGATLALWPLARPPISGGPTQGSPGAVASCGCVDGTLHTLIPI